MCDSNNITIGGSNFLPVVKKELLKSNLKQASFLLLITNFARKY